MPTIFFKFDEQTIKAPRHGTSLQKFKIFWPGQNWVQEYQGLGKKFWPEF